MTTDRARWLSTDLTRVLLQIALLAAAMVGLGFLVTDVLGPVWPFNVEDQAVHALVAARTPALDRLSNDVSLIAFTAGLGIVIVAAGCLMRLACHRWREALFLFAALLAQGVIYKLTSQIVARPRPAVLQLDGFPPLRSFISGHTSAAVALYGGIAVVLATHSRRRALTVFWWVILLVIPVAVAFSRVYRGMHHPSDVAASFLCGLGCLWILRRAMLAPARPRGSGVS